jgi:arabinogalactan endo-1,4-beta-galactosidase
MWFSFWAYTEEGMNNLDKAIKKVINKYFKKYLVIARDYNWEKIGMPEDAYDEENIFVKMKIK